MRKVNKIMLITVSMLLSLVLITSSVVSTTFAKYATTGQSSTSARVAKWGATIDVTLSDTLQGKLNNQEYGDLAIISFDQERALGMSSGAKYPDALTIKFSGESEVKLKVKLVIGVVYEGGLVVPKDQCGISADTHFVPMGIKMKANYNNDGDVTNIVADEFVGNPWFSGNDANNLKNIAQSAINAGIKNKIDVDVPDNNACVEKVFAPNEKILFNNGNVNELVFSLEWPDNYTDNTGYKYNDIGQYLMDFCADGKCGINFTIIIEQVG